jgi:hypothetical protein
MTATKPETPKTTEELMLEQGYIPANDAARAIGTQHVATIHRQIHSKRLEGQQVGVFWYVKVESLLAAYGSTALGDNVRAVLKELGAEVPAQGKKKRS